MSEQKWTECSYCGHWFKQELAKCSQCNEPNDGKGPKPKAFYQFSLRALIGAVFLAALLVGVVIRLLKNLEILK